ncbi:DUF1631 domain-containing protein [Rhodoferax sediminis]|uniref:DUF1631 domain-containing protein n=1 Tax=Rhodoferax sediminis TaxID=2509614 RepID=A0A515D6H1_9BURK|nr:DUF1631 domain-containing protein [Rhodoferax sediminis]QDL35991.1 DUF1631 domain-containing protein [Rhodoferax sediminis]
MAVARPSTPDSLLARQARQQFVAEVGDVFAEMASAIQARLETLADQVGNPRNMQERRDAMLAFQELRPRWQDGVQQGWRKTLTPAVAVARDMQATQLLSLVGNEEVENTILASRLVQAILDKTSWELNDLRLRIQRLDAMQEMDSHDAFRPEVLAALVVQEWSACGLDRVAWALVDDVIRHHLVDRLIEAYHHANEFLIQRGVMPEIDLKPLVKRNAGGRLGARRSADAANTGGDTPADTTGGHSEGSGFTGGGGAGGSGGVSGGSGVPPVAGRTGVSRLADETRMLTGSTPLARVRMRAQGVIGQLKRLLSDRVSGYDMTRPMQASPALAQAISDIEATQLAAYEGVEVSYDAPGVEQAVHQIRERTASLKSRATNANEKATIEIVALMFQSILAEERIPASVRVWFARLQMPVLRVALAEPEFFGTLQHPARQLIDRMGSCVMGFDARAIGGSTLEAEIKRVVQVIEQYPETGRRVFQLVHDEFQKFLAKFLTEKDVTQRVTTVVQQVEQKETLAIQYTIEMRNMLSTMPVRDEIRDFLFKVWAEVLALAAVKNGPQHDDTLLLKRAAVDLVWAASAKPNRSDRARVIQDLPKLLQQLRQGMTQLNMGKPVQEVHLKVIGDTLADAFLSKTAAIPQAQIDDMAQRLANLEDFVTDDGTGDLPFDAESLEMMLGIDASSIDVVSDGGSRPTDAMLGWAQELELGSWFTLDHNNKLSQAQYVWRSERKQLHLFASTDGRSYLIQARRLAAYLQAGLLVPTEEEALTVRATREALAKLDANPERLLN